jgi:hypothetical protein
MLWLYVVVFGVTSRTECDSLSVKEDLLAAMSI